MPKLLPDQSFYPSPTMAMQAAAETLAYVALLNPDPAGRDALAVLDVDPESPAYGAQIARVEMPGAGDELHHFGWNACSSCLCPYSPHPHMQRRYLVVPGLRSSRIHILDTQPDPRRPRLVKVIEAEELLRKTGYSRPHTSHCGPDGIYINALGDGEGNGPGGIFVLDPQTFEIKGRWERERGPQYLAYDFWWHLGHDTMLTSEWGTPKMVEDGVNPELLLAGKYGNALHVWDLHGRRHLQKLELGPEQQMVLELRPAHNPDRNLRLRRRRHQPEGPLRLNLDVAPRRHPQERHLARAQGDRDSRRASHRRRPAAAAEGVRRGTATRHGY